jgi:flagellar hook-basal body complex protein FliE
MSRIGGFDQSMTNHILDDMVRSTRFSGRGDVQEGENSGGKSFMEHLKESIAEVNQSQKVAESMATDIATGKSQDIHETMLAATQADLSFSLMVQVRNKALEAYQEIMRMPV